MPDRYGTYFFLPCMTLIKLQDNTETTRKGGDDEDELETLEIVEPEEDEDESDDEEQ